MYQWDDCAWGGRARWEGRQEGRRGGKKPHTINNALTLSLVTLYLHLVATTLEILKSLQGSMFVSDVYTMLSHHRQELDDSLPPSHLATSLSVEWFSRSLHLEGKLVLRPLKRSFYRNRQNSVP